jgi:hypothetical protein
MLTWNEGGSILKAEAADVAKAHDDSTGQLSEIADTLRQIRDLLAERREPGVSEATGVGVRGGGF